MLTLGQVSLQASGCGHYKVFQKEVSIHVDDDFIQDATLETQRNSLSLTYHRDHDVSFRYFKDGKRISLQEIQMIYEAQTNGKIEIRSLIKENVLFSYESDCSGVEFGSTGRYELILIADEKEFSFVYPNIEEALNFHYAPEDRLLDLFIY